MNVIKAECYKVLEWKFDISLLNYHQIQSPKKKLTTINTIGIKGTWYMQDLSKGQHATLNNERERYIGEEDSVVGLIPNNIYKMLQ